MIKTQYIRLDMTPGGTPPVLFCSQYDVGRPLGMVVYNGGEVVDLSTYTCTIEATRTDGTAITASVTASDSICYFLTTATMTNVADKYPMKLVLFDSDSRRVASLTFLLCVTPATMDENAESIEEDKSLYQQYTETVQSQIVTERQQRQSADSVLQSNISAEASARAAAISAEASARQSADNTLQSNINAEAAARRSADTALQSNITAEASTRANADASLQSQINQYVTPSTQQPDEVVNARVGADGTTYQTLGDAIRGQVGDLKGTLNAATGNKRITFTQGKYIDISGKTTIDVTNLQNGANNSVAVVSCSAGDSFTISAQGGSGSRAWAFVDASGTVLERADASITVTNMVLTAPNNAAHLVINDTQNSGRSSYKGILLSQIADGMIDDSQVLYSSMMEQGGANTAAGYPLILVDNANEIRTRDFAAWASGYCVSLNNGYEGRMLICDSSGNFITVSGWGANLVKTNVTNGAIAKVVVRKTDGSAITPDEIGNAIAFSDIPMMQIVPKADNAAFTEFKAKTEEVVNTITEDLYVYSSIDTSLEAGIYDVRNILMDDGQHVSVPVTPGDKYIIVACCYTSSSYPMYLLRKNRSLVSYENVTSSQMEQKTVLIPEGVDELIINSAEAYISVSKGVAVSAKPYSKWHGKKIAWFGTSIPETSTYNAVNGYPEYVGKLLGATVYNEAVGSSCARRGFKTAETSQDPYGWTDMGIAALWNMGSTVAEKNELITNWESKWRALTGYNQTLTDEQKAKAISCSYENKLVQKYITENPVDLYVFDHGYNDWKTGDLQMDEDDPFDMSTFQGAMNTYIKLILESNPRARIVLISHYEDQEFAGLVEMQDGEARYWNLPFCKLYERLGWANNRTVTTEGYWSSGARGGVWIESGGESRTINLKEYHMPDGKHPNLDISGKACMDIAYIIADFIDSITPSNNG